MHKSAVLWSAFMGLGAINWGFDILVCISISRSGHRVDQSSQLSAGIIAVPTFQEEFGYLFEDEYIISAGWQIAFNISSAGGGLIGGIITGYVSEKLGKRMTMGIACIISVGSVFMQVFAKQAGILLAGKVCSPLHFCQPTDLSSLSMVFALELFFLSHLLTLQKYARPR